MTGKFGTQTVVLSYCTQSVYLPHCEWRDYSNKVFVDEAAFREYFDKPWFLESWEGDYTTLDDLMDEGLLGFDIVEVIGT